MHYDLEYGGGLGDMFYQLYERSSYNVLRDLAPGDTAQVVLVVLNPFAHELFAHHPKRDQFVVRTEGYWAPANDVAERQARGLAPAGANYRLPVKTGGVEFYPSPEDQARLDALPERYLVLAAGAGSPDRSFPDALVRDVVEELRLGSRLPVVAVGRSYERDGRSEPVMPPTVINYVDQLSVAGTAKLVQRAAGLVTAHSALNLLGWCERVPQLLLFPQSVLDHHAVNGKYDQWLFGAQYPNTVCARFDDYTPEHVRRFLGVL